MTISFAGEQTAIDEVVSILLCSGMTIDEVFRWLERRLKIGRFAEVKK